MKNIYDEHQQVLDKLGSKSAFIFVSAILGGHEKMAINVINKFNNYCDIDCYVPNQNTSLKMEMHSNRINYIEHNINHKKIEIVHSFFNPFQRQKAKKLLMELNKQYDSIVIIQGDIELGSVFLLIAKKLNIKVISYIPYTHSFKKMGAKLSFIKDFLSKYVYRSCDCFITISPFFKKQLNNCNPNSDVFIIENFLNSTIKNTKKVKLNESVDLFMIGRIHFLQKGQDILIEALSIVENTNLIDKNIILHIIGDGPDLDKLKVLVNSKLTKINVVFYGWVSDVWNLSIEPSLIVIPSNFEGVPLVMLEALECNIPIIAAGIDGMLDYLPHSCLYFGHDNKEKITNLSILLGQFFANGQNS